eukprot:1590940-Pyramimonas_sp.AAC.1
MTAAADTAKRPAAAASGARASPSHKKLIALAVETLDGWSLGYQQELQATLMQQYPRLNIKHSGWHGRGGSTLSP